ncbi:hypothetical protein [Belliella aquatica]|uniref:Uncharacterized protein n=1 Tax=Belliella aquatica TaxID=1323734 RepID=A0ABQ1MB32_9BACT|nr:hypothetical protein [Belliella aquatica]MCH7406308.1 hypothetical protein [Belliella aquatica]GGC37766.1 hypothetical protein GCM10010993_15800 [Belliella aquatica]
MDINPNTYRYKSQYEEIFSCAFRHEFYPDQICTDLIIEPNFSSRLLIKNYKLIFKPFVGGFSLAANKENSYNNAVFGDSFDLDFEFRFKSPYFFSFTSLNINPEVKYFLNDDFETFIHFSENLQVSDNSLDKPGLAGILRLKHTNEFAILPRLKDGVSDYQIRNKVVLMKTRLVKIVFICYSSLGNLEQFDGLQIKNEGEFKGKVSFENLEVVETTSGFLAYKFISKELVPMKSFWNGYFVLERSNQLGTYKKSLPNPRPQSIKFDEHHNTYISENYVKL